MQINNLYLGDRRLTVQKSTRIHMKSFGCPTNLADGEVMAGCLANEGYTIVKTEQDADVIVFNTCAVKSPTENRMIDMLRRVPRNKKLLITGCLPLVNFPRLENQIEFDGVLGPAPGLKIVEVLEEVLQGKKVILLTKNSQPDLKLPNIPRRELLRIIPINYGCVGACSYCCVRNARGSVRSYRVKEIIEQINRDLSSGISEFWLTSQDSACYGKDLESNLPDLLRQICAIEAPRSRPFFIRVGMMTPNLALELLDDLIDAYKNSRIFKFLHVPIQSGDDHVLKLMNREYTAEDCKTVVNSFRIEIPRITISTDVICGFPGETNEAFNNTLDLVGAIQPDIVNISKFFPRPNTLAYEMPRLNPAIIRNRSSQLAQFSSEIALRRNQTWINWEGPAFLDERGKGQSLIGRNFAYKPIVLPNGSSLFGKNVKVRVSHAFSTYLQAAVA